MKGPAYLLAGIALFSLLDANNKLLSGQYGVAQAAALRYLVLLALLLGAWVAARERLGPLGTRRPGLHAARTASMMVSVAGFYLGFRHLPLAEGYLVFFTAPFLTLAMAALTLRERVPPAAWGWCALGFAGVLLAVAPKLGGAGGDGGGGAWFGYAAIFAGTFAFAITQTVNRMLRGEPGLGRILLWPSIAGVALYGPFALRDWVAPPPPDLGMLLAGGLLSGAAVLCTAVAFRSADAARLGPYNYAALPAAVVLDVLIWGAWPDAATVAGGVVVVAACALSERARRRGADQGMPAGKAWRPSSPSGSAVTERTAESGSGP